ncbi:MAG: HEAT repeat domain-containing protein [Planctomycetes bacterium]|nr:HEAT repeat domain-containing protein [Planctomycetota bacterium]
MRARPTPARRPWTKIVVVGVVLLVGAGLAALTLRQAPVYRPDMPETDAPTPPPDFPPAKTEEERVQRLIEMLLSGDPDDAEWSRNALARGGEPARAAVAETARRCIVANRAFVEHALDLLLRDPRREDEPLAAEGLDSVDSEVVNRACLLLGRSGGPLARESLPRIASIAARNWPAPKYAMDAIVALGGDAAVAQLERIAGGDEFLEGVQDQAVARMGLIGGDRAKATLLREFASAVRPDRTIAAAEGLIAMGDMTPLATLRSMWAIQRDQRALTLLARAKDDLAFTELEARVRAPVESEDRRIQALVMIDPFPAPRRLELMRYAADAAMPREVRIEAWSQLWRDGDATDRDGLLRLLRSDGASAREDRIVAALVAGRVRDPSLGAPLAKAEALARADREARAIMLRAMVLCGGLDTLDIVVGAMAGDTSAQLAPDSIAYEIEVVLAEAPRPFLKAMGPLLLRALGGKQGSTGPMATRQMLMAVGFSCGPEASSVVESYLTHEDRHIRETAADVLVVVGGPTAIAALKNAWWRRQDKFTRAEIARALERLAIATPVR